MIQKSVLIISCLALFASSVSLKGTSTAMTALTPPPFAGTNDQVVNTAKIYKVVYFTNDGSQSTCLKARDFYLDNNLSGPNYAHLSEEADFDAVWRFEETNGIYYVYIKTGDKEYCAVPNYDTRNVEFTEDKQCWTWKIDWLDNGYTIGTWDYQSVYLYLTPFDIQGRPQEGAPQPLFLEEEQKGKWGLTPIGDYYGDRIPFNVPDGKLHKLTNEKKKYLTLIDEIDTDHFEAEQRRGFVTPSARPNQTFVFEPIGSGYVLSLGVDNLDDGQNWKGYCLTWDIEAQRLYFTNPANSCVVWDVTTNDGGKTVYIGLERETGSYQFLKAGELDAYIRNQSDDYIYLWDSSEGARWNLVEDNYACDPLNVEVDTTKWYKIWSMNEGETDRYLESFQGQNEEVTPELQQKLVLHTYYNSAANYQWYFVRMGNGYHIRIAQNTNEYSFLMTDWCISGDGQGNATTKAPSMNQCHLFVLRKASPGSDKFTMGVESNGVINYLTSRPDLERNQWSNFLRYDANGNDNYFRLEQD